MNMTSEQLRQLGAKLLDIGVMFTSPASAVGIKLLFEAGTELNSLVSQISKETEETSPEVWVAVRRDYIESVNAFELSVRKLRSIDNE